MKLPTNILVFLSLLVLLVSSCTSKTVTFNGLLFEMTDRTNVTYFADPSYSIEQFSSYDRKSVGPEQEGWFANQDYTHFIREENHEGRREFVLFDASGPGAIVRFWMTFAGDGASEGILRIYLDGYAEPVIADSVLKVISGGLLAGEPLSSSVSPLTDYRRRGHNLYLPIPYASHCKVTYECDAIEITEMSGKPSVYYNINYRKYEDGTVVESFSREILENNKALVMKTGQTLLEAHPAFPVTDDLYENSIILPSDSLTILHKASGQAISEIVIKIKADKVSQALRSTVLSIVFDKQRTVWIPVGEFFGTGYEVHPSQTWFTRVKLDGTMSSKWLMPFREAASISLVNYGSQPVEASLDIGLIRYKWKSSSMYFGSSWHEYHQLYSAGNEERETDEWHFDVNYVDIIGKGHYVGDALTVFNTADAWWGEGDEKIFVDGETFPSCIGTGTEDYYGYAWCRPEVFSHPFIAQPTGAGNFHPGMTVNMRYRSLDAMPFEKSIQSDIELWHWALTKINFAMASFYYVLPGYEINVTPDIESVRRPVALSRSDIYKPEISFEGILEGEWLKVARKDGGQVEIQSAAWYDWSENSQLWWHHAEKGHQLEMKFIIREEGNYEVLVTMTQARDYGIVQPYINGNPAGQPINGYIPSGVLTRTFNLGRHKLKKGQNTLTFKILGKDPKALPGNMAGIDYLKFTSVK